MEFTFTLDEMARLEQFKAELSQVKQVSIDRDKAYEPGEWERLITERANFRGMTAQLRIYCMRRIKDMAEDCARQARQKRLKEKHGPANSKEAGEDLEMLDYDKWEITSESGTYYPTIDHTYEAIQHYYFGFGKSVNIGEKSIGLLMKTRAFRKVLDNIKSGNADDKGHFSIDLTNHSRTFHIGNTNVEYWAEKIKIFNGFTFRATFRLFVDDGFWDPLEILEKGKHMYGFIPPDGKGSNLELGGAPYDYIPQRTTIYFNK